MKRYITILLLFCFVSGLSAQNKIVIKPELKTHYLPFGFKEKIPVNFPKTALVLSGGGARGLSQIGVIASLKKHNIHIDEIVGTSMGSIVGGLYAAGYSIKQIDSIAVNTDWKSFFSISRSNRKNLYFEQKITEDRSLISFRMDGFKPVIPTSINNGEKVANFLNLLAINSPLNTESNFDKLLFPYRAVSTNLVSGNEEVLKNGSLSKAMLASSSVSFLLPPVEKDSLLLVDGGVIANVPVNTAIKEGNSFVIASNVSSPLRNKTELRLPWEIADQLVSIPSKKINEQNLANADIIIFPNLHKKKNNDFTNIGLLIKEGFEATEKVIPRLKNKLKEKYLLQNKQRERFFYNLHLPKSPNKLERKIFGTFSNRDSVSSNEIFYQISLLLLKGDYNKIYAEIDKQSGKNIFRVFFKKNPIVKNILISGVKSIPKPESIYNLTGKPFNSKKTVNAIIQLLRDYRSAGFTLTRIRRAAFNNKSRKLKIEVSEDSLADIKVTGNNKTLSRIVTREFPIQKNQKQIFAGLKEGSQNLRSTNLFKRSELKLKNDSTTSLIINVKEKPTALLRFGLRVDNENFTQGFLDAREENLFGTGTELGFLLGGGQRTRTFVLQNTAHRIFNTYLTYSIHGFFRSNDVRTYETIYSRHQHKYDRKITGEYRQQFYGISIGLGTQVKKFGKLIFQAKYNVHNIFVLQDSPEISPYKSKVFTVLGRLSIDTQDKYPYPNSGMYFNTYFETGQKFLGGELPFIKFFANYKNYINLSRVSNLSLKIKFGFGDNTLPLGSQFSLGGQNNFFGMRDFEYRGRQIFSVSLAYRYRLPIDIFYATYLNIRYDLGSIWQNRENIRLKDLRHGIGLTFSLDTPIGPADFSVGQSFFFRNTIDKYEIVRGPVYFYFRIGFFY